MVPGVADRSVPPDSPPRQNRTFCRVECTVQSLWHHYSLLNVTLLSVEFSQVRGSSQDYLTRALA